MATLGFLKITVFWIKCYDIIIPVHDVTKKVLTRDLDYNVNLVKWPKSG